MSAGAVALAARTSLELSVLRSLRRMNQAVAIQGRRPVEGDQVTMAHLLCLGHLTALGNTSPGVLATQLGVSQVTISGMIDRLEALGYVRRSRSPIHERKARLDLTEPGMEREAAPSLLQEKPARRLQRRVPRRGITMDLVPRKLLDMTGEGDDLTEPPLLGGERSS